MWHDFQLYAGIVPEATQAVSDIAAFARARFTSFVADASQTRGVGAPRAALPTRGAA